LIDQIEGQRFSVRGEIDRIVAAFLIRIEARKGIAVEAGRRLEFLDQRLVVDAEIGLIAPAATVNDIERCRVVLLAA
jgi:hypothetical protein